MIGSHKEAFLLATGTGLYWQVMGCHAGIGEYGI